MYISVSDRNGGQGGTALARTSVPFRLAPTIVWLGIVSLFTDVSSESVAAVLPLYLTGYLGLSVIAFGVLDGINQGAGSLVRMAAGWLSDRAGRPKQVALAGYGLSATARLALLFAGGFWALTGTMAADRIGKGIRTAPRDALITVNAQPEHLARHFGVHRMLDTIGAALGPLLASAILLLIPSGYSTVFVVSLAFAVIGVAALALFVPDQRAVRKQPVAEDRKVKPAPGIRWARLHHSALGRLLLTAGVLGLLTVGDGFIYLALQNRNSLELQWFPMLYVGTNAVFLLLAIPLGRLADRWGRTKVFIGGHLALVGCYLLASLPFTGACAVAGCLVLLGIFYASTDGVLTALASQLVTPEHLATGISAAQTVVAVSRMAASAGFGVLWFAVGPTTALVLVGGLLALAVLGSPLLLRGPKNS
ncbi:MFS transporter [Pseudarthrobacter sp. C4D7]|uniref:MFS transporter n=1 Tax=Pseudarthrobacter sp. C4D7 TaxID=2735268 RepID=UPI001585B4E6|nr:MFS transporter [Pseudarthrobacter sp. C4D7]NUT70215.1 MFS transporter [Pseudarthrobacter sp. C4D7]